MIIIVIKLIATFVVVLKTQYKLLILRVYGRADMIDLEQDLNKNV